MYWQMQGIHLETIFIDDIYENITAAQVAGN